MKIGIDLRPLLHGKASGVAVYTRSLVREMIKHREYEFVLFLSGRKGEYEKILDEFEGPNVKKVFWKVSNRALNFGFWFFGFPRVDLGVDVMFLPDMRPIRLPKDVKKVVTCHDLSFLRFSEFFSWKSRLWYKLNKPAKYFKIADRVISVSKFTQKELRDLLGVKSEVVYEGAYVPDSTNFEEVQEEYGLSEKYILSLSTLEPRKNLRRVIEAFEKSGIEHDLVVAGDFDRSIFAKFKLPESEKVRFIGEVPEEHKKALYNMSDGLVYVSLYEGFGLPPLEALCCSRPVLTSKDSPMEEVCGEVAIYVDPEDVSEIAEGMKKLVSEPKDQKQLVKQVSKFSWENAAIETLEILKG